MPSNKSTTCPLPFKKFPRNTCLEVINVMRQSFYAIYVRVRSSPPPPPAFVVAPPPTLKVVQEWEGVGIWRDATPRPWNDRDLTNANHPVTVWCYPLGYINNKRNVTYQCIGIAGRHQFQCMAAA